MHTLFTLQDARGSTTSLRSRLYVLQLASTAAVSGFLFGFDTAVINAVLYFLRRQFSLSNSQTELAASALLLGCLVGAAAAGAIGDRIGRRKALMLSAVLFSISTLGAAMAGSITQFSIGRLIGGLAIGLASVLAPVYIAEVAPAHNRGRLVSINQVAIVTGILSAYIVSWRLASLGESSWRWMLGVAAIPSALFLVGLVFIPESPRWLLTQRRRAQASEVLARIYGSARAASLELSSIEAAVPAEPGSWRQLFSVSMRRPLALAITLAFFSQITGINTVLYYGSILISEQFKGQSSQVAFLANVIVGVTNLVGSIIALSCVDRWGRRPMLLSASAGMALSLALFVISLKVAIHVLLVSLFCVLGYTACFAFAMGPVPWIVIAELFPNRVRGRAASIATSALWAGTLLVTSTFLSLIHALGISGTFSIYASLCAAAFVFVWKYIPETRGKTLEGIQSDVVTQRRRVRL